MSSSERPLPQFPGGEHVQFWWLFGISVAVSLGMLAIDQHWPGQPDGHLGDPEEALDVPGQDAGVEGVAPDVLELGRQATGAIFSQGVSFDGEIPDALFYGLLRPEWKGIVQS